MHEPIKESHAWYENHVKQKYSRCVFDNVKKKKKVHLQAFMMWLRSMWKKNKAFHKNVRWEKPKNLTFGLLAA